MYCIPSHAKFSRHFVAILSLAIWLCGMLVPAIAFAQAKPQGKNGPPIPFFGEGNPLESFFGRDDDSQLAEIRKVQVSQPEEQDYGKHVLQAMREDWKRRGVAIVARGEDVDYVRKLLQVIRPFMKNRDRYGSIQVLVAQTDETDAFSIPGGTIIIYRGMIEFAGSEAALVGVLGHELSHLDRGHQLLPIQRSKLVQGNGRQRGPMQLDQFFRQASLLMSAFTRPFHPQDETEADEDGATWAYRAGYDPRELSSLFARLNERNQIGNLVPSFLRTHPYHADRQAAIEQLYHELAQDEPRPHLYVGRPNLRQRMPMSVRKFAE